MEPQRYAALKLKRIDKSIDTLAQFVRNLPDNTPERLKVKEIVHKATIDQSLNRKYEME